MTAFTQVAAGVYRFTDTCQVYVVLAPDADRAPRGIAVDLGSGDVLDHLAELGLVTLDAVLMTHHHRDQGQGLPRAVAQGIPIHVPPVEQDLFAHVDQMWATRPVQNDYNLQQDRFSLLDPVPVAGVVPLYREHTYGAVTVRTVPTPGHTMGSVSYLIDRPDGRIACTGDLIHAPGQVWSLGATQWSYTGSEGPAMCVLSARLLRRESPTLLLPSHGEPMPDADAALALLAERMQGYVDSRRLERWDLTDWLDHPYVALSPHLLWNRTANACSYVLLSATGAALVIDYGYDLSTGWPPGTGRASRLPWLASLPALKRDFGVTRIEVALATHYHDDHVAGLNLLREVEGTEVWLPEHVAPITADPMRTDLPCQWFDPIPADRVLRLGGTVDWQEYTITTHDLPGHTRYAAAFAFVVDGVRVLATGDQQTALQESETGREVLNYQYRNRFRPTDYQRSAALYTRLAPGLFVTGHWGSRTVDAGYLAVLADQADDLVRRHQDLLPAGVTADGELARLEPFFATVAPGRLMTYTVELGPVPTDADAELVLVLPAGWTAERTRSRVGLPAGETVRVDLPVRVGPDPGPRRRLAVDVTLDGVRYGQVADAVVDVVDAAD